MGSLFYCSDFIWMKELNEDLTRKLEIQTQRLELLTSQSMVNDGSVVRHPDARTIHEITPQYADEGDEVVNLFFSGHHS